MATFEEYKNEMSEHKASNLWVDKTTSADEVYWKLIYSGTAMRKNIVNYPDDEEIKTHLVKMSKIMSMMAQNLGEKIEISCGYRNQAVNNSISGAAAKSQHMRGQACDLNIGDGTYKDNVRLFLFLINNKNWENKFDQIIWEEDGNWVHVSFKCTKGDDVTQDSSYEPRAYSRGDKVMWLPKGGNYTNIWTSTYKKEDENGMVYFTNVPGLNGAKYNGTDFSIDQSLLDTVSGSQVSGGGFNGGSVIGSTYKPKFSSGNRDPHLSAHKDVILKQGTLLGSSFKIK